MRQMVGLLPTVFSSTKKGIKKIRPMLCQHSATHISDPYILFFVQTISIVLSISPEGSFPGAPNRLGGVSPQASLARQRRKTVCSFFFFFFFVLLKILGSYFCYLIVA